MNKQVLAVLIILHISLSLSAQNTSDSIVLNQLGFYLQAPKIAAVKGNTTADVFYVINTTKKDTAYKDTLSQPMQSLNSSTITRIADFSAFTKEGNYYISIPDVGNSYTFSIDKNANHAAAKAALKGYYYIRSNIPLEEKYA